MEIPADAPRPRLCHIVKRDDFNGYGFNLHAEKSKPGQFIGTVDPGSPCADAGLKEGDRILEVNGVNISLENHKQVVLRIKAIPNETRLLVVDQETENYYRRKDIVVRGDMPNVLEISSKDTVVTANHHQNNGDADDIKDDEEDADKVVHETVYNQEDTDAKDDQGNEITSSPSLRKEHDNGSVVDNAERDEGLLVQGVDQEAGNCKVQILVTADIESSSSEADNGVATNQAKVEPDLPVPEETIEVPCLPEGEQREPGGQGQKNESIDDGRSLSSEEDGQQDKFKHQEASEAAEAAAPVAPVAVATADTGGQSTTAVPPVNDSVQAGFNASGNAVVTDAKTENSTSASEQAVLERTTELPSSESPPNLKREVVGKTVEAEGKDERWGGLNLNMTAKEMRQRIGSRKKMDPRKSSEPRLDFQKKYDIIQTL